MIEQDDSANVLLWDLAIFAVGKDHLWMEDDHKLWKTTYMTSMLETSFYSDCYMTLQVDEVLHAICYLHSSQCMQWPEASARSQHVGFRDANSSLEGEAIQRHYGWTKNSEAKEEFYTEYCTSQWRLKRINEIAKPYFHGHTSQKNEKMQNRNHKRKQTRMNQTITRLLNQDAHVSTYNYLSFRHLKCCSRVNDGLHCFRACYKGQNFWIMSSLASTPSFYLFSISDFFFQLRGWENHRAVESHENCKTNAVFLIPNNQWI